MAQKLLFLSFTWEIFLFLHLFLHCLFSLSFTFANPCRCVHFTDSFYVNPLTYNLEISGLFPSVPQHIYVNWQAKWELSFILYWIGHHGYLSSFIQVKPTSLYAFLSCREIEDVKTGCCEKWGLKKEERVADRYSYPYVNIWKNEDQENRKELIIDVCIY